MKTDLIEKAYSSEYFREEAYKLIDRMASCMDQITTSEHNPTISCTFWGFCLILFNAKANFSIMPLVLLMMKKLQRFFIIFLQINLRKSSMKKYRRERKFQVR